MSSPGTRPDHGKQPRVYPKILRKCSFLAIKKRKRLWTPPMNEVIDL